MIGAATLPYMRLFATGERASVVSGTRPVRTVAAGGKA
jgi:hypothetical protein